jgi:hypothetical protein
MAPDKVQAKIKRGMLKIRQNSLARTGTQIDGGQGEVQGRLVAIYLSAKTVTFPLLLRIGLHPLQNFPQCKGLGESLPEGFLKLANHRISRGPGH